MARPDDIPEDVWAQAEGEAMRYVEWLGPQVKDADAEHVLTVSIARAIMAERERCATVVDDIADAFEHDAAISRAESAVAFVLSETAKAIREGHQ